MVANLLLSEKNLIEFGGITITYYGFFITLAIIIGAVCGYFIARLRKYPADTVIDMVIWAVPLAVIGARLYYVVFDAIAGGAWDFVGIIRIWKGGLAIYGAVWGAILGIFILSLLYRRSEAKEAEAAAAQAGGTENIADGGASKLKKPTFYQMADLGAPFLILGQAIGRWGNYVNGEAFGGVVENPAWQRFPWAVFEEGQWHLATFFLESMWCLLGFILLITLSLRKKQQFPGFLAALYMIFYGAGRFVIEGFRTDSLWLVPDKIRASKVVAVIMILWGVWIIVSELYKRHPAMFKRAAVYVKSAPGGAAARVKRLFRKGDKAAAPSAEPIAETDNKVEIKNHGEV